MRGHRRRCWSLVPLAVGTLAAGALLLTGCGAPGIPSAPGSSATPAPAAPPAAGPSGTVLTDPAQGYRPAQELVFSGLVDGQINNAKVDCNQISATSYTWTLTGELGGGNLELTFNTNRFRGPGKYQVNGISDAGVMTMTAGSQTAASDAAHGGTFTVDEVSETGSMNLDLNSPDGKQHVSGPWSCTGD
jgi:hypothetical protein